MENNDKNRGIYKKFTVERTDGQSGPGQKHENCRYFVIDLDHDKFAKAALLAYSDACKEEYGELSKDILLIIDEIKTRRSSMENEYYIISKKHMYRRDFAILFWGPNRSGYTYNLNYAGVYCQAEADELAKNFHRASDILVLKSMVDPLAEEYVIDKRALGKICKNNKENRVIFDIKLTELLTGWTAWNSGAFAEPKTFVYNNRHTIKLLSQIEASKCVPVEEVKDGKEVG